MRCVHFQKLRRKAIVPSFPSGRSRMLCAIDALTATFAR